MQDCPIPDRRGETWEEVSEDAKGFAPLPHHEGGVERFIVVGPPQHLGGEVRKPGSWWHPVLWIDDCGPPTDIDPQENGINEEHFHTGRYVRLG